MSNRDDFTEAHKRILGDQVGWRCSNPECRASTKGPHSSDNRAIHVGVAAHIHAAAVGGPRFSATQTTDERSSLDNGIYLCETCAARIDRDVERYTAELLLQWKDRAKDAADIELGRPRPGGPGGVPRAPVHLPMSEEALAVMNYLVDMYVRDNYPNHHVWTFGFGSDDRIAPELRALGLLTALGLRGPKGFEWRLTDAGQRWIMAHRG
jgi:hypothetical protein